MDRDRRQDDRPDGRPGPELVGVAIADAIENPATPLRVPVGADAEMVLSARQHFDDAAFEAAMRKTLDLHLVSLRSSWP